MLRSATRPSACTVFGSSRARLRARLCRGHGRGRPGRGGFHRWRRGLRPARCAYGDWRAAGLPVLLYVRAMYRRFLPLFTQKPKDIDFKALVDFASPERDWQSGILDTLRDAVTQDWTGVFIVVSMLFTALVSPCSSSVLGRRGSVLSRRRFAYERPSRRRRREYAPSISSNRELCLGFDTRSIATRGRYRRLPIG